jgi:hypothetical protein
MGTLQNSLFCGKKFSKTCYKAKQAAHTYLILPNPNLVCSSHVVKVIRSFNSTLFTLLYFTV